MLLFLSTFGRPSQNLYDFWEYIFGRINFVADFWSPDMCAPCPPLNFVDEMLGRETNNKRQMLPRRFTHNLSIFIYMSYLVYPNLNLTNFD